MSDGVGRSLKPRTMHAPLRSCRSTPKDADLFAERVTVQARTCTAGREITLPCSAERFSRMIVDDDEDEGVGEFARRRRRGVS
jgi:hypothetical protein